MNTYETIEEELQDKKDKIDQNAAKLEQSIDSIVNKGINIKRDYDVVFIMSFALSCMLFLISIFLGIMHLRGDKASTVHAKQCAAMSMIMFIALFVVYRRSPMSDIYHLFVQKHIIVPNKFFLEEDTLNNLLSHIEGGANITEDNITDTILSRNVVLVANDTA